MVNNSSYINKTIDSKCLGFVILISCCAFLFETWHVMTPSTSNQLTRVSKTHVQKYFVRFSSEYQMVDGTLLGHGKGAYYYFLHTTTPRPPIFAAHVVRIASILNMYYEGLNNFFGCVINYYSNWNQNWGLTMEGLKMIKETFYILWRPDLEYFRF